MPSLPEAVVDSVSKLGLNGSSEHTNGTFNGDVKVRTICCVGAGYVGTFHSFFLNAASLSRARTALVSPPRDQRTPPPTPSQRRNAQTMGN